MECELSLRELNPHPNLPGKEVAVDLYLRLQCLTLEIKNFVPYFVSGLKYNFETEVLYWICVFNSSYS